MKRLILILLCGCALIGFQSAINCSRPLESLDDLNSLFADTVVLVDTVTRVDTVTIIEPDTTMSSRFCSRLSSTQQEIVWLFQNQAGRFRLEFAALADQEDPPQMLLLEIDGRQLKWYPAESMEFVAEQKLGENAIARIESSTPHAFGHEIYICLKVTTP